MFEWIRSIEEKLHAWKARMEADLDDVKARLDALEGKTAPKPEVQNPPAAE